MADIAANFRAARSAEDPRRRAAERDAVDLAQRVDLLSDRTAASLAEFFVVTCRQRRLTVPDLLEEEWEDEQRG